ncbi:serine hydrolase domain-containing protein [soil metagenome]
MFRHFPFVLAAGLTLTMVTSAMAQSTPTSQPDPIGRAATAAGFSTSRLERLTAALERGVEANEIPGAVMIVQRHGEVVYSSAIGYRNRAEQAPMTPDSRFALASMTKPIVSVAAMILVEQGRLSLSDPVSKYIPEFATLVVGHEVVDPATAERRLETEPMVREPTIQDLFRHTSGLTYPPPFGNTLVQQRYGAAGLLNFEQTNQELVGKLVGLPLAHQPGTTFEYGFSTDVLGRVIEIASGQTLAAFIAAEVTGPLGMVDTSFTVPDMGRFASTGGPAPNPAPHWHSGGGGMVGTASDYIRFAQMLLNGGELDGVRTLSPHSVALMRANHLPPDVRQGGYDLGASQPSAAMGQGFGLGFAVRVEEGRNPLPGSVGDYYWAGSLGTYFWIDPKEDLVVVLLTAAPLVRTQYRAIARDLVYQALVEPAQ